MTLNQLRNVVAIAERGSLRSAARFLGVTQPAITRSIRELEHELGVTLFERHASGMALTAMGQVLVRRATSIQSEVGRVHSELAQLKGNQVGSKRRQGDKIRNLCPYAPENIDRRRLLPYNYERIGPKWRNGIRGGLKNL